MVSPFSWKQLDREKKNHKISWWVDKDIHNFSNGWDDKPIYTSLCFDNSLHIRTKVFHGILLVGANRRKHRQWKSASNSLIIAKNGPKFLPHSPFYSSHCWWYDVAPVSMSKML